jgi:hypothetical protein
MTNGKTASATQLGEEAMSEEVIDRRRFLPPGWA